MYRVVLPYACYGVEESDGKIVGAAPIARWAIGRSLSDFTRWVAKKGGSIHKLGETDGQKESSSQKGITETK